MVCTRKKCPFLNFSKATQVCGGPPGAEPSRAFVLPGALLRPVLGHLCWALPCAEAPPCRPSRPLPPFSPVPHGAPPPASVPGTAPHEVSRTTAQVPAPEPRTHEHPLLRGESDSQKELRLWTLEYKRYPGLSEGSSVPTGADTWKRSVLRREWGWGPRYLTGSEGGGDGLVRRRGGSHHLLS